MGDGESMDRTAREHFQELIEQEQGRLSLVLADVDKVFADEERQIMAREFGREKGQALILEAALIDYLSERLEVTNAH